MIRNWKWNNYLISTNKSKLQLQVIHSYLVRSYWAKEIPMEFVKQSIENSLCFGVYFHFQQVGFARLITDYTTFAYLADVFIIEEHRGKGLGHRLTQCVLTMPEFELLRRWMLTTQDAHGLYAKSGFVPVPFPERIMVIAKERFYERMKDEASGD